MVVPSGSSHTYDQMQWQWFRIQFIYHVVSAASLPWLVFVNYLERETLNWGNLSISLTHGPIIDGDYSWLRTDVRGLASESTGQVILAAIRKQVKQAWGAIQWAALLRGFPFSSCLQVPAAVLCPHFPHRGTMISKCKQNNNSSKSKTHQQTDKYK